MPREKLFDVEVRTSIEREWLEDLRQLARRDRVSVAQLIRSSIGQLIDGRREELRPTKARR